MVSLGKRAFCAQRTRHKAAASSKISPQEKWDNVNLRLIMPPSLVNPCWPKLFGNLKTGGPPWLIKSMINKPTLQKSYFFWENCCFSIVFFDYHSKFNCAYISCNTADWTSVLKCAEKYVLYLCGDFQYIYFFQFVVLFVFQFVDLSFYC